MGLITKKMIDIIQEKEKHFPEDFKRRRNLFY